MTGIGLATVGRAFGAADPGEGRWSSGGGKRARQGAPVVTEGRAVIPRGDVRGQSYTIAGDGRA